MILHVISVLYMFGELENQDTVLMTVVIVSGFTLNLFPYSPVCCMLTHGFFFQKNHPLIKVELEVTGSPCWTEVYLIRHVNSIIICIFPI